MSMLLVDTDSLAEAEVALSAAYSAKVRLHAKPPETAVRTQLLRSTAGSQTIHHASFDSDVHYETEPPPPILLCRLHAGTMTSQLTHHREPDRFGPGDVAALGALEGFALEGEIHHAQYDIVAIDRRILDDVAGSAPSRWGDPVRLTGEAPVSAEANQHMADAIDYVCNTVARNDFAVGDARLGGAIQRYLAASMLAAFPHTALPGPNGTDQRNPTPFLLRRAIRFIAENAHCDVSIADIASHVHATPRAVQLVFRKHRGCTPMEYLRRVRLQRAHIDLLAGHRETTTVTEIAQRWGFAHVGRFAVVYRQYYGESPHETLSS